MATTAGLVELFSRQTSLCRGFVSLTRPFSASIESASTWCLPVAAGLFRDILDFAEDQEYDILTETHYIVHRMLRVWRTLSRAERQLSEQTARLPGVADRVVLRCTPNAVLNLVERFDRRGIEPFELFKSEFGQNSFKIQDVLLENSKSLENFNTF